MARQESDHLDLPPRPLRIAMVATPWYTVPPDGYGGLELIVAALSDALVERGHEVTLFGAGQATATLASFVSTYDELQFPRIGHELPSLLHSARVNRHLAEGRFDVVHDHSMCGPLSAASRTAPTVVTVHGPPDGDLGEYYEETGASIGLVAISEAQRLRRPGLPWIGTVHNSINMAEFTPRHSPDGPVLWLARFCHDKGPELAIEACRAAGLPLLLVGKCNEPAEKEYLDTVVRPRLGDDVQLILNAPRSDVRRYLSQARALIMPIRWPEPFGMVMIEAMASATPVVALRGGAVPEIVAHGRTGFICDDPAELPDALLRVGEIDPEECLTQVAASFSAPLMAQRYEAVYWRAMLDHIAGRRLTTPAAAF